jgi:hypothetical protein
MTKARLEGDKLPLPMNIMQKAGLMDGDEVEVRLEEFACGWDFPWRDARSPSPPATGVWLFVQSA